MGAETNEQSEKHQGRLGLGDGGTPSHSVFPASMGWLAILCGTVSALGYTLANVCLRSVTHLDPVWVSQVKSLPTVLGAAPVVIWSLTSGRPLMPTKRLLVITILAAIVGQVAGNIGFQWALGRIGLALTVPLIMGSLIVSGVFMGRYFLGDTVTSRMLWASAILILAIVVLSLGAAQANDSIRLVSAEVEMDQEIVVFSAVGVAILAGLAYSCLGVVIRYATNLGASNASVLFVVSTVGFLVLGGICVRNSGFSNWRETANWEYQNLILAGVFNLIAFAALTKALQMATVVFVNALNASQTAMAATIGVVFFQEPLTGSMLTGVLLTIFGLWQMRRRTRRDWTAGAADA